MQKVRYRLVYNRKNQLNRQGEALVQVEAYLNRKKIYLSTNVYLRPDFWDKEHSAVYNHPHAEELNVMLFEFVLHLQEIELGLWKHGISVTLNALKSLARTDRTVSDSFVSFSIRCINDSVKRESTKSNLMTTVTVLKKYQSSVTFKDLSYGFLMGFESYLRNSGKSLNTIAKHMRQLRTLVNEAINQGFMSVEDYPFRKYKIRQEKGRHEFLTPTELRKLESAQVNGEERHVLDAFLFCCYSGLRYSDFLNLEEHNFVKRNGRVWLHFTSVKTGTEVDIPLYMLFSGKAMEVASRYTSIGEFVRIGTNNKVNRLLDDIARKNGIRKKITYHTSRHTCATLLIHDGVPVTTVQKILGHASLKTTQVYLDILPSTIIKDLKSSRHRTSSDMSKTYPKPPAP